MKKRFSEEQIGIALRQAETEVPVAEVLRKMRIPVRLARRQWMDTTELGREGGVSV